MASLTGKELLLASAIPAKRRAQSVTLKILVKTMQKHEGKVLLPFSVMYTSGSL